MKAFEKYISILYYDYINKTKLFEETYGERLSPDEKKKKMKEYHHNYYLTHKKKKGADEL